MHTYTHTQHTARLTPPHPFQELQPCERGMQSHRMTVMRSVSLTIMLLSGCELMRGGNSARWRFVTSGESAGQKLKGWMGAGGREAEADGQRGGFSVELQCVCMWVWVCVWVCVCVCASLSLDLSLDPPLSLSLDLSTSAPQKKQHDTRSSANNPNFFVKNDERPLVLPVLRACEREPWLTSCSDTTTERIVCSIHKPCHHPQSFTPPLPLYNTCICIHMLHKHRYKHATDINQP